MSIWALAAPVVDAHRLGHQTPVRDSSETTASCSPAPWSLFRSRRTGRVKRQARASDVALQFRCVLYRAVGCSPGVDIDGSSSTSSTLTGFGSNPKLSAEWTKAVLGSGFWVLGREKATAHRLWTPRGPNEETPVRRSGRIPAKPWSAAGMRTDNADMHGGGPAIKHSVPGLPRSEARKKYLPIVGVTPVYRSKSGENGTASSSFT